MPHGTRAAGRTRSAVPPRPGSCARAASRARSGRRGGHEVFEHRAAPRKQARAATAVYVSGRPSWNQCRARRRPWRSPKSWRCVPPSKHVVVRPVQSAVLQVEADGEQPPLRVVEEAEIHFLTPASSAGRANIAVVAISMLAFLATSGSRRTVSHHASASSRFGIAPRHVDRPRSIALKSRGNSSESVPSCKRAGVQARQQLCPGRLPIRISDLPGQMRRLVVAVHAVGQAASNRAQGIIESTPSCTQAIELAGGFHLGGSIAGLGRAISRSRATAPAVDRHFDLEVPAAATTSARSAGWRTGPHFRKSAKRLRTAPPAARLTDPSTAGLQRRQASSATVTLSHSPLPATAPTSAHSAAPRCLL